MTDHNELRALALAATPGPWYHGAKNGAHKYCVYDKICWLDVDGSRWGDTPNIVISVSPDDGEYKTAAYIAAANPATVLALLDEMEAAHASRREAQDRVAELTEKVQARVDKLAEKMQALGRDVRRNKLDAARYRLLRSAEGRGFPGIVVYEPDTGEMHVVTWVDADAAIDAAMSMEGGAA